MSDFAFPGMKRNAAGSGQVSGTGLIIDENTMVGSGTTPQFPLYPYALRGDGVPKIVGSQPGMAVNGAGNLAIATSLATAMVAGLIPDHDLVSINSDDLIYITTGIVILEEWGLVTDEGVGLTPNAYYYLSPNTHGNLTLTKPTTPGNIVIRIGLAVDVVSLLIQIGEPTVVPGG